MPVTTAMATSFKAEILQGIHNFNNPGGDSFRIALYTNASNLGATATAYTATNEVVGTGYTATGLPLSSNGVATGGTTAFVDFDDVSWTTASFTAQGALIYNDTDTDRAVSTHSFGGDVTVSNGTFTVQFPAATNVAAIIRIE